MAGSVKKIAYFIAGAILVALGVVSYTSKNQPFNPENLELATYLYDQKVAIPTFEFTDHNLQPFNSDSIRDKWTLWFFGFTHCPDICPQTLGLLSAVLNKIESEHNIDDLSIVFVSVDPERDQPAHLKAYVSAFHPNAIGVTSSQESLDTFLKNMGVIAVKTELPEAPGHYTFDHSSAVYLIAPDTGISALFNTPHTVASISHDVVEIVSAFN